MTLPRTLCNELVHAQTDEHEVSPLNIGLSSDA